MGACALLAHGVVRREMPKRRTISTKHTALKRSLKSDAPFFQSFDVFVLNRDTHIFLKNVGTHLQSNSDAAYSGSNSVVGSATNWQFSQRIVLPSNVTMV